MVIVYIIAQNLLGANQSIWFDVRIHVIFTLQEGVLHPLAPLSLFFSLYPLAYLQFYSQVERRRHISIDFLCIVLGHLKAPRSAPVIRIPVSHPMESRTNDSWLWQILAILGSALSMIAIGMLLIHFNNRPIFGWNGLTLNAIIAIFSVISKSMLAYTLSECLGQAKWIWISSQQRPLNDINVIDSGSRGPLGSFKILTQPMIRSFISVGAIVVILSVVIDPFVQLTIGKADSVNFDKNSNVQIA